MGRRAALAVSSPPLLLVATMLLIQRVRAVDDAQKLEDENEALKQRLQLLQEQLKEEEQYSYVVARGLIAGVENVYMETMEVQSAKQWCNSNAACFGFSFLGDSPDQVPEDEVTVTFKGAPDAGKRLEIEPDQAYVSYVKHSNAQNVLGHVGDAGMQAEGRSAFLVGQWLGFSSAGLIFVLGLGVTIAFGHRCKRSVAGEPRPLLPVSQHR